MLRSEYTEKPDQNEEQEIDVKQYLWVLLRRKWIILLIFFCTVAGAFLYVRRVTPRYRTSVKVLIGEKRGELSLFGDLDFLRQGRSGERMETYCELLKTHQLMRTVVEDLKLHELPAKKETSDSISWLGKLRQLARFGGTASEDVPEDSEAHRIRRATEHLRGSVKVSPIDKTRVIQATVSGTDPDKITNIANELADVFIAYNLQSIISEAKGAHDFISEQLGIVEKKLRQAEENLKAFKEKESVVELTEEAKVVLGMVSAVETGYNTTIARRQEAEARRDAVRRELEVQAKVVKSSTTIAGNPLVQSLKSRLYTFEIELAGLLKIYPEYTPEIEQMKTKIAQTKERLAEGVEEVVTSEISSINPVHQTLVGRLIQLESDVIAYGVMAEAQTTFVEQYKTQLEKLPSKELQLARLTRDKNVSDQTYMMLMQRGEEAQLAQAIQVGNISVVDPAIVPLHPYMPRRRLSLMLGAVLGLALGVGMAFFLESMDNTFRTEDEVKRCLNLPLLGTVPLIRCKPNARSLSPARNGNGEGKNWSKALAKPMRLSEQEAKMLTHLSVRAPETETYRMLVTNIQFAEVDNPIQTLLITSSAPGEGKTLTATNLAIGMAQSGKKTLLVDTDLRKPMVHRLFRMDKSPGLTECLHERCQLQEVIRNSPVENLSLITAGSTPPNAPQLLASQKMEALIEQLKEQFDMVIFDTPPAVVVTDPAVLGSKLDAMCLVIEAERTNKNAALKAKELLSTSSSALLGVILNKVDVRKGYGYYYYYYYYYADEHEGGRARRKKGRGRK